MDKLKDILNKYNVKKTLDVGCGRGEFIPYILEYFNGCKELTALDKSDYILKMKREDFGFENINFIKADALHMPFDDCSFDTVCISNSLHHMADIEMVLSEMKRVLKPGGLFVINEMYCDNQSEKQMSHVIIHHFGAELDRLSGVFHNPTLKRQEIIDTAKGTGLKLMEAFDYNTGDDQKDDMTVDEEKKELDEICTYFENRIKKIEDKEQYDKYYKEFQQLKDKLYKNGLMGATELMVILKK